MKTTYLISTLLAAGMVFLSILMASGQAAGKPGNEAALSEMLEKGVYSEETKGDIDAAMKLYQQVLEQAKNNQSLAAQAQYRLGVCQYKKKNYTEATAAFEKLLKDFPEQKELVGKAREYLAGAATLLPEPWADGEDMRLEIKFPTGFKLGMTSYGIASAEYQGRKVWQPRTRMFAGVQSFSQVQVELDSFKPLHSRWKHALIGDADTVYEANEALVKLKGKDQVKKVPLDAVIYDNEEAIQLMRRLPLSAGYKTTLRFLSSLAGGQVVPVKVDVSGPEKVDVPAGSFDCWKVELSIQQTFWYSTDTHRHLAKFEGGGVVAELASVTVRKPGDQAKFADSKLGFSLTAPGDWMFYQPDPVRGRTVVVALDPQATALTVVTAQARDNLEPQARDSLRAWADIEADQAAKSQKQFRIRPDSWKDITVAGRPGLSFVADSGDGSDKKVTKAVFSYGASNATFFTTQTAPEDFQGFLPAFESLVKNYQTY